MKILNEKVRILWNIGVDYKLDDITLLTLACQFLCDKNLIEEFTDYVEKTALAQSDEEIK